MSRHARVSRSDAPRSPPTRGWIGASVGLVAVTAVAVVVAGRMSGSGDTSLPGDGSTASPAGPEEAARAAARRFLDGYVDDSGRVVRHDQGGDTVSEGQAYAMLAAVAVGDGEVFQRIWDWTRRTIQRDDGLLAYRWADESVADGQPAADADLDAARALLLAAERFGDAGYRREAGRVAAAILARETSTAAGIPVLLPGPWADTPAPVVINPSYLSPRAFGLLARSGIPGRWQALRDSGYGIVDALTADGGSLPPDWAESDGSGQPQPAGAPGTDQRPRYGYEAARVPIRMAADCEQRGRDLAARLWPLLEEHADGGLSDVHDLDGSPAGGPPHPVSLVAAAAAAQAAGEDGRADTLLQQAEELDRSQPTYYGAAWIALGRVLLHTDLLDECPG